VLKTIHGYLGRDLARVTLLGLVAFTLVMTVFAIMEPLRKQGLASGQVASLFVYTLPVMLSLTLPFAALLAASIVYGRFAQDRELTACRASGIGTLRILQPAILLGVGVTVISLALTNFVAPEMARQAELAVIRNIKRIAAHKIQKEGFVEFGKGREYVVHARTAEIDEERDALLLTGVVAGRYLFTHDQALSLTLPELQVLVASSAYLKTFRDEQTGNYYASVYLTDPVGPITRQPGRQFQGQQGDPLRNLELDNPSEEKAEFYDWPTMIQTLADPTRHKEIQRSMEEARRTIRHNRLLTRIARAIEEGGSYDRLETSDGKPMAIGAGAIRVAGDEAQLNTTTGPDGTIQPVEIVIGEPGMQRRYRAERGSISVRWQPVWRESRISLSLSGNIAMPAGEDNSERIRKTDLSWGQIQLPPDPELERAPLNDIYLHPEKYTDDKGLQGTVQTIRESRPPKIRGEIIAEMHSRIAFGLSAVLLVALGAALGLVFRGGQLLAAFTIAVIPASIVIAMTLMGKKMISNPASSDLAGMVVIWGGLVALLALDAGVYWRLSRQ
jgi:lipopolysaccharide export LptBFGC system permease protein LptF